MSFDQEIQKLARTRRAFLRFAQKENNYTRAWAGPPDRRYAKTDDSAGLIHMTGTVTRFGTIQRSLANFLMSLEVPSMSIELLDPYREWRKLAGRLDLEDQLTYRAISLWLRVLDDQRTPLDSRITVASIRKVTYPSGGKVQLDCQVSSGSFLGAKVPRRFITTEDFPNAPPETQGLAVPIIYGRRYNDVSHFDVPVTEPPPTAGTGLPGTNPEDDTPASLPPQTGSEVVYCSDLWTDTFEAGAISGYSAGAGNFTLVPGAGADGSQAIRPLLDGAELTKTLSPPRRAFCVEWSSDSDRVSGGVTAALANGINVFRVGERDIEIYTPWAGTLTIIRSVLTPGTRQTFKLEGVFATKNLSVTLTAALTPSQTILHVSTSDASRMRAGMNLKLDAEIVRVLSVSPSDLTAVNVVRAQFDTYAALHDAGTVIDTYDVNGYLKFSVNGAFYYNKTNTDLVRSASDTGNWTTVAWSPNGDGDNLKIGSGLLITPPGPPAPPPPPTASTGGSAANPAPTPECQPAQGQGNSPSGAAVRALLVGTYNLGNTGDFGAVAQHGCGKGPFGTEAALAAELQASKDAGTLVGDWATCVGYSDAQAMQDLEEPIPTDHGGLAALIGESDLNCLLSGDCGGTAVGADNVYVLSGHALKKVSTVYVLKPVVIENFTEEGDSSPTRSDKVQVLMVEGVDYRQGWLDINKHRYHLLAFSQAQVSENCEYYEVTANVEGIETVGDGSGELIVNADDMVEHIMLNWILNAYEYGPWFTNVAYAPDVWDRGSVKRVKDIAARRIPGGYKGMGTLDVVIEAREWIRELLISFDLELYFNNMGGEQGTGAWSLARFDPYLPMRMIPHWDAATDQILKDTFATEIAVDQMINTLPFFAGPTTQKLNTIDKTTAGGGNADGGGWLISGTFKSEPSIARYGLAKSDPIYLKWTDDPATASDVMKHYLQYQEYPPIPATFRSGFRALGSPLGSLVRITHPDGPGSPTGWDHKVCKVTRSDIDMDRLVANVTVLDVGRLMKPGGPGPAGDEVLVMSVNGLSGLVYLDPLGQMVAGPACDPAGSRGTLWGGFAQADNGVIGCAGMNVSGGSDCFALYDANFTRTFGSGTEHTHGLGFTYSGTWYTHQPVGGQHWLRVVTSAGAITSKGPLPAPPAVGPDQGFWHIVAASPDGAVAYYGSTTAIKRWNLSTNAAMSDLATEPLAAYLASMLCLRDGSIIAVWNYWQPVPSGKIVRYSPSGTVIGTFVNPAGGIVYVSPGPTDATIWASGYPSAYVLQVSEIQVATGTILRSFQLPLASGSWDGPFLFLRTPLP